MKYSIVIPENCGDLIKFAAEELKFYLEKITDTDTVIGFPKQDDIVFSLGETYVLDKFNIEKAEYRTNDDSELRAFGDVYLLYGVSEYAIMFGVYEMLKALFGLKIYTDDDFSFETSTPKEIDYCLFSPDISIRTVGICPVYGLDICDSKQNIRYMRRMKLYQAQEGWGVWSHSFFLILPPKKYAEDHPDWYTADKKMLCWTNKAMRDEFTKNLKEFILSTPDATYYMLGHEDNKSFCGCENCKALFGKYNHFHSAMLIDFANDIVGRINEWSKTACPERKLEFLIFAYLNTVLAPVEKTKDGFKLIDVSLHMLPNLSVLIAPVGATSSYSYFDERSMSSYAPNFKSDEAFPTADSLYAWSVVSDKLNFWTYNADFLDYQPPFLMWTGLDQDYRKYKELNTQYIFEQGAYSWPTKNFTELKIFIVSQLAWDSSQDMQKLIKEFISNYYGKYASQVQAYFDFLNAHREVILNETGREAWGGRYLDFEDSYSGTYWSKEFLNDALSILYEVTNTFKNKEFSMLNEEEWRVLSETISCEYLYLRNYMKGTDKAELKRKIEVIKAVSKRYDFYNQKIGELGDGLLSSYIEKWENELNEL